VFVSCSQAICPSTGEVRVAFRVLAEANDRTALLMIELRTPYNVSMFGGSVKRGRRMPCPDASALVTRPP
jgi:hypothetical protein